MSDHLNREAILGKIVEVKTRSVEAFGGKVLIKELSAGKAAELYGHFTEGNTEKANILWVIASVVDPQTLAPIFSENDRPGLEELSFAEVSKISKAALELNGFSKAEETVKNSEASPNGASSTA